jgi:hypothetical protein
VIGCTSRGPSKGTGRKIYRDGAGATQPKPRSDDGFGRPGGRCVTAQDRPPQSSNFGRLPANLGLGTKPYRLLLPPGASPLRSGGPGKLKTFNDRQTATTYAYVNEAKLSHARGCRQTTIIFWFPGVGGCRPPDPIATPGDCRPPDRGGSPPRGHEASLGAAAPRDTKIYISLKPGGSHV